MSLDATQRRGMIADLARRLALCSGAELQQVDQHLLVIERMREDAEHADWSAEWSADDHHVTHRRVDLGGEA